MNDPFALLGVRPGDTEADLARAYRQKMFHAHPDRGGDETVAKELAEAYELLKLRLVDGRLRGIAHRGPTPVFNFDGIFRQVFGGHGGPFDPTTASTGWPFTDFSGE